MRTDEGIYVDDEIYALCVAVIEEAKRALKRNGGKDIVFVLEREKTK